MILSELIPFLKRVEASPKKSLSQNFLIDANIIRKIVEMAHIQPGDAVLEIGPGPGALTSALLDAGAHVFAIEMDRTFAKELIRFQTPDKRLKVVEADFLKFPLTVLRPTLKVVANLPYHITAPILEKICQNAHLFSSMTLMVQKEVAIRMGASAGSKDYSPLTVFLQYHASIGKPFLVPASCFYPRPKVDSAVIRLDFQAPPAINPLPLARKAFQQRRKMLSTSLGVPKELLASLDINPNARPEDLPLNKWVDLAARFNENNF